MGGDAAGRFRDSGQLESKLRWKAFILLGFMVLATRVGGEVPLPSAEVAPEASTNSPPKLGPPPKAPHTPPGGVFLPFQAPIAPEAMLSLQASKNPQVPFAMGAMQLPLGFSPTNNYPMMIVSGSSDGDASSIDAMRYYTNMAVRLGWVVLAADGPFGKPQNDSPPWRWAMLSSALRHIHTAWPSSTNWPVACVGYGGGAKWSAIMASVLAQRKYNLVGLFMASCNEDTASEAAKIYFPATRFKATPIFLSSGTENQAATPLQMEEVRDSLEDHGFKKIRLERFKGSHHLDQRHLRMALKWFLLGDIEENDPFLKSLESVENE